MEHSAQHKLIISASPQLAQRNWERQSRQGDELEISKAPYGAQGISLQLPRASRPCEHMAWGGIKAELPSPADPGSSWQENSSCLTRIHAGISSKKGTPRSPGDPLQEQRGQTMGAMEKGWRSAQVLGQTNKSGDNCGLIPFCRRGSLELNIQMWETMGSIRHILWWSARGSDQELRLCPAWIQPAPRMPRVDRSPGAPHSFDTPPHCTGALVKNIFSFRN